MKKSSSNPVTINQWKEALNNLGLAYSNVGQLKICMLHFHPDDVYEGKQRKLRLGAMPSLKARPMPPFNQKQVDIFHSKNILTFFSRFIYFILTINFLALEQIWHHIDSGTIGMQSFIEPQMELYEPIKSEPIEAEPMDLRPLKPRFTYSNRKKYVFHFRS